jgi:hypothetical protein
VAVAITAVAGGLGPQAASASFGVVPGSFSATPLNEDGTTDTRAGSHPFSYVVKFEMNHNVSNDAEGSVRDALVDLPPGMIGDPEATALCPRSNFDGEIANCPGDSQVGTLNAVFRELTGNTLFADGPVYNLVPPKGVTASFGFAGLGFTAVENASLVHGKHGYVVEVSTNNVSHGSLLSVSQTIWGVPAAKAHDAERECFAGHLGCSSEGPQTPFLTLPTDCAGASATELAVDPVEAPGEYDLTESPFPSLVGCSSLEFQPTIAVRPEASTAATPTGLSVDLHIPQPETASGLAEADLKDATVALPAGMVVNPSLANGLATCTSAQIGLDGNEPPSCPAASEIGTVEVDTPLISHPLPGSVYAAAQGDNPFGSLLAIYIVVDDPATGIVVKLAGHVEPNPETGQLTTTFLDNPQLPFEDLKVDFLGGPRAPLITPSTCGEHKTQTSLVPWTSPEGASASPASEFQTTSGPGGSGCVHNSAELPNTASFAAGTTVPLAGTFAPFVMNLSHPDGSQPFAQLDVTLPPGLLGKLAGVARCSEAELARAYAPGRTGHQELAQPSCSAAARVGSVTVSAGAGPLPVQVAGQVYLAGPYEGAPFSLAVITPAVAGPFDLGVVVVRAGLYVDPLTAQVTVRSDPFPTILQGIPLSLKALSIDVDRSEFVLNPTSCQAMAVTGSLIAPAGPAAALSSPFRVDGCRALPFAPTLTGTTLAHTSRLDGAALTVKLTQRPGESNIAKVQLQIPPALPARLETLKLACTEAQFAANPAGCPPASMIGTGKATTPLLNVPLVGPAYLVSHGGAAFPDVVFLLQGEGVTIRLVGKTDIKHSRTYSRFETVPDAPVSSFEATFPQGPHSIFGAYGAPCEQEITLTESITAQSGAQVNGNVPVAVTGCPRPAVSLRHARVKHHSVLLTLKATRPSRVTISGVSIQTRAVSVTGGVHTISLPLSRRGRRLEKHARHARLSVIARSAGAVLRHAWQVKL